MKSTGDSCMDDGVLRGFHSFDFSVVKSRESEDAFKELGAQWPPRR
jgi:hypothetical protein